MAAPGYTYSEKIGEWTGSATTVQFTASKQVRVLKIVVTVDESILTIPTISPASGTYYGPIEVTMTCLNENDQIHYTVDGSNPTASSPQYTAPFVLSTDAVVKAVAVRDNDMTQVVSATYHFEVLDDIPGIAAATALPDETTLRFTGPVVVLAQNRRYLYVKDDTGCALIFGNTGQTYLTGDVIPAGFVVTKLTYNGEPEFQAVSGFKPATDHVDVSPLEITADQVCHDLFAHYVLIKGAMFQQEGNFNYSLTDSRGNTCSVYFGTMALEAPYDLTQRYDVVGIVGSYCRDSTIYQLLPVELVGSGRDITLCDLDDLQNGTVVTFNHEVTALAQVDRYLYLKDGECYGLVYGNTGQTYTTGDIIPAGWGGTISSFDGRRELMNLNGFKPAVRHENIVPEEIQLSQIGHEWWGHYVIFKHVLIDFDRKVLIDGNGNEIPISIRSVNLPECNGLYGPCDVTGIVTSYRGVHQLLLLDFEPKPEPISVRCINDVKNLPNGSLVRFETPLTAVYQNENDLYVTDSCGVACLLYGYEAGGPFYNGELITGVAQVASYNGRVQLNPVGAWTVVGTTRPVQPEVFPIEDVSQDMMHMYVRFEHVVIDESGDLPLVVDETGEMQMYYRFDVDRQTVFIEAPYEDGEVNIKDINWIIDFILSGKELPERDWWAVEGFLTVYRDNLELYPIRIIRYIDLNNPDVDDNGEVNIADVNKVVDVIL